MQTSNKNISWYRDWFGKDYLKVYPHRDEAEAKQQIQFVINTLKLNPKQKILDLGCGNGRHALRLSKNGFNVTCLDLSSVLLSLAKKNSGNSCCLRFVRADMRRMPFREVFDVLVSFFTTFGYFKTDEENLKTLQNIKNVLKPGGLFMQDYLNKEHVITNLIPFDSRKTDNFEVIQERSYNAPDERIEKKITLKENGKIREYFESVRLYTLDEMQALLNRAGLELTQTFGNFDGSTFTDNSPRLILIGQRTL